jgi:hypothetical protein
MYWVDVELRIRQRETELDWTQDLVERLESGELPWPAGHGVGRDTKKQHPPRLTVVDEGKRENMG